MMGWDNAPHHRNLEGFPNHFHAQDDRVYPSSLVNDPASDIILVAQQLNNFPAGKPLT
ncbi:MAG: toxin-antitoxin system TumE family protein [Anaerolineae bacterium]